MPLYKNKNVLYADNKTISVPSISVGKNKKTKQNKTKQNEIKVHQPRSCFINSKEKK